MSDWVYIDDVNWWDAKSIIDDDSLDDELDGDPILPPITANPDTNSVSDNPALDIAAPLVYTFTVDKAGQVGLFFKCDPGYESDFGTFLGQLLSGGLNEDIVRAMAVVFQPETLEIVMNGMGPVADEILDDEYDEKPIILPSAVFQGVNKT